MVNLEIDGKPVQVAPGSTVMDAAHKLGIVGAGSARVEVETIFPGKMAASE